MTEKYVFYKYPIFYKCCDYINNDFWKDIFIQFAKGKFKKGFGISNDCICIKNKSKVKRINIDNSIFNNELELKKMIETLINSLDDILRIKSESEIEIYKFKIEQETNILKNIVYDEWKDVKIIKNKIILLQFYLQKIKQKYNLTSIIITKFNKQIKLWLYLKYITNDNIIIKNNNIDNIDNIIIKNNKLILLKPKYIKQKTTISKKDNSLYNKYKKPKINNYIEYELDSDSHSDFDL